MKEERTNELKRQVNLEADLTIKSISGAMDLMC